MPKPIAEVQKEIEKYKQDFATALLEIDHRLERTMKDDLAYSQKELYALVEDGLTKSVLAGLYERIESQPRKETLVWYIVRLLESLGTVKKVSSVENTYYVRLKAKTEFVVAATKELDKFLSTTLPNLF